MKGFSAINVMGVLFVRPGVYLSDRLVRHERIHTAQMRELAFVFFYVIYLVEWLVRLMGRGSAYRNISFEREAYDNEHDEDYLNNRRHFAWLRYLRRPRRHNKDK